jgi:hypothetical protein
VKMVYSRYNFGYLNQVFLGNKFQGVKPRFDPQCEMGSSVHSIEDKKNHVRL